MASGRRQFVELNSRLLRDIHWKNCITRYEKTGNIDGLERDITDNMYFITITYTDGWCSVNGDLNKFVEWKARQAESLYDNIVSFSVKGNRPRKKYMWPVMWLCVDGAGTRFGGRIETSRVGENLHHHGIMVVHEENRDVFENISEDEINALARRSSGIADIQIEPVCSRADQRDIADYNSKLVSKLIKRSTLQVELDMFLPKMSHEEFVERSTYIPLYKQSWHTPEIAQAAKQDYDPFEDL